MKERFYTLYDKMANSNNVAYMHVFGQVHKEMMEWFIANKPTEAQQWLDKLESIQWDNYLTRQEANDIIAAMTPRAPWTREQWDVAMTQHGFASSESPCYNSCALFVTMSMIYTDSSETLGRYVEDDELFHVIYDLAVDKLKDADKRYDVRRYFGL